jgi:hypothetical protein
MSFFIGEENLRQFQLRRKTVKVTVTNVYEVEMDDVDDADIKSQLSEVCRNKLDKKIRFITFLLIGGDYLQEKSVTSDGLTILDVKDTEEQMKEFA